MSIFDRFIARETDGQKRKSSRPASSVRTYSELDTSAADAKELYPEDSKTIDDFVWAIRDARRVRSKKSVSGFMEPMNAEAKFFLSRDRLAAYACVLPPENGGEELTLENFLGDMHYEGIVYGVLEEKIPREFSVGYYHVFPVARGTLPQAGQDGRVIELFQRRSHMHLEVQNGSEVDFSEAGRLQPIRKGAVICRMIPPKPGTDGMDVTGTTLPSPPVASVSVPHGKNIVADKTGQTLTAATDGILYIEKDRFCIHEQKIIDGDLDQFQGTLRIAGNLYIGGNVDGGVSVEAAGDIVVNGKIGQASVTSTEGMIHVRQGICGADGRTFITAASQVQSPIIEWAQLEAGASVIAETISNSTIHCGGTVYAMTGRGLIVTSRIYAQDSILCRRIGNVTGDRSRFSVGYPPDVPEKWLRIKTEMAEAQAVIERLWDPVINLRKKGSRITEKEKYLLSQLEEQRNLYLKRLEELKTEIRAVNQLLDKKSRGRIRCEKLYPVLEVQIGRRTEEVITVEEKCNIRVEDGAILLQ